MQGGYGKFGLRIRR
ncbi:TPA: hypothetical protein ACH411_005739 [Escherichia coli]